MEKSPQLNMKQVWRDMWEHPKDPHVPDYREVGENGRRYPDHFDDDRDHKVVYLIKHFGPNGEPVSAYTEMSSSNGLKQYEKIFEQNGPQTKFEQLKDWIDERLDEFTVRAQQLLHLVPRPAEINHQFMSTEKGITSENKFLESQEHNAVTKVL